MVVFGDGLRQGGYAVRALLRPGTLAPFPARHAAGRGQRRLIVLVQDYPPRLGNWLALRTTRRMRPFYE